MSFDFLKNEFILSAISGSNKTTTCSSLQKMNFGYTDQDINKLLESCQF